jgi:hypothetical protein
MTLQEMTDFVSEWISNFNDQKLDDIGLLDEEDFKLYDCMKKLSQVLFIERKTQRLVLVESDPGPFPRAVAVGPGHLHDRHRLFASELFKTPYSEVKDYQRRIAKSFTWGLAYDFNRDSFAKHFSLTDPDLTDIFRWEDDGGSSSCEIPTCAHT